MNVSLCETSTVGSTVFKTTVLLIDTDQDPVRRRRRGFLEKDSDWVTLSLKVTSDVNDLTVLVKLSVTSDEVGSAVTVGVTEIVMFDDLEWDCRRRRFRVADFVTDAVTSSEPEVDAVPGERVLAGDRLCVL